MGSFSYTSCAGFFFFFFFFLNLSLIFIRVFSFKHPVLALFWSGEFLLHIPCLHCFIWEVLLYIPCWLHFYLGTFSYISRAGFFLLLFYIFIFFLYLGSFSYTSRAGFIFIWVVSLTHPVLALFFWGEFLLHIPCWFYFYLGSFSYTSRAGFIFLRGVSLTRPILASSTPSSFLIWRVSLPHPMLASFLSGEFLLHIPCWLFSNFYLGSLSYSSIAGFILLSGIKNEELRTSISRRQCSSARKNRNRKKKSTVEDAGKIREKYEKWALRITEINSITNERKN